MLIQAALNGDRTKSVHPGIPLTLSELITDAISCRAAGAQSFHVHPHTVQGHESLEPDVVNQVAGNLKAATGVPVGVTTGEWIEPDVDKRIAMIREWTEPDYASVNICEDGSIGIMSALLEAGIGIEAGVWTAEDAKLLGESGLGNQVTRVLVEPGELQVGASLAAAIELVGAIHRALDRHGIIVPRLQHADGVVTWVVLEDAFRRGIDTRIGFEDTLRLPEGQLATDNAELVRAAVTIRNEIAG